MGRGFELPVTLEPASNRTRIIDDFTTKIQRHVIRSEDPNYWVNLCSLERIDIRIDVPFHLITKPEPISIIVPEKIVKKVIIAKKTDVIKNFVTFSTQFLHVLQLFFRTTGLFCNFLSIHDQENAYTKAKPLRVTVIFRRGSSKGEYECAC